MSNAASDAALPRIDKAPRREAARFLAVLLGLCAVAIAIVLVWGLRGRDHFGQIPLNGDTRWYKNYAHLLTREMQDRDILYHGIGQSVANLRRADIVILGHSVLEFGIVDEQVRAFEREHGVRIFNLTNPGVASVEFTRQLLARWHVHPKIWIINADDFPANFFNPQMDDFFQGGRNSTFRVAKESRLTAYLTVAARNIRWRLEGLAGRIAPDVLVQPPFPFARKPIESYRAIDTGNFFLEHANDYMNAAKPIRLIRSPPCPTTPQEVEWARGLLERLGGTAVLTLVPYERWCPDRVRELADAVGVEAMLTPDADYPVFDGTHMSKAGGVKFTAWLLDSLAKSRAFQVAIENKPDPGLPSLAAQSIEVCVRNTGSGTLFVSLRSRQDASDHMLPPGGELRRPGLASGLLCSDTASFNRDQCPNSRRQSASACPS